jgi:hypothetical protein
VIPLSETITITQMHVPVDDTHTNWYAFFTSFDTPLDKEAMRQQRLRFVSLPDYLPKAGRHNDWGFDPEDQRSRTFLGMGEDDINVHDQWAVESMGAIQDRTREHLGTSDKVIMANRRLLVKAIETVRGGGVAPRTATGAARTALSRLPHRVRALSFRDRVLARHAPVQLRPVALSAPRARPRGVCRVVLSCARACVAGFILSRKNLPNFR